MIRVSVVSVGCVLLFLTSRKLADNAGCARQATAGRPGRPAGRVASARPCLRVCVGVPLLVARHGDGRVAVLSPAVVAAVEHLTMK